MKAILEALYGGRILPFETIIPESPEYKQLNQKIIERTEQWQKKLSETDYDLFEEFLELCHDSWAMETTAAFVYGFRLGAALLVEVLTDREELFLSRD
jgi:hypothetical protein